MRKGGPVTQQGKEIVSMNAVRHGLRSSAPVIPGVECPEEWEAHRRGIVESLAPDGSLEALLAERVALGFWRLARVARFEQESIALARERIGADFTEQFCRRKFEVGRVDARAVLDFPAFPREIVRSLRGMLAPSSAEPLSGELAVNLLTELVDGTGMGDPVNGPVPGFPDDFRLQSLQGEPGWTTARAREILDTVAEAAGAEAPEMLRGMLEHYEEVLAQAEAQAAEVAAWMSAADRSRCLPSDRDQDRVIRYETQISRELYKALHELEALQARRRGQALLLARVQVHGPSDQ